MSSKNLKVFNIILVFLTIIMCFPLVFNIYLQVWGKNNLPTGITSTYVTTITDPYTKENLSAIEARYFQNTNGKGKEVVELLFNAYSGVDKQAVYSRGFQLIMENNKNTLYYYDRYDGGSFETGHEYEWGDPFIVDIDGETYAIRMDGKYEQTSYSIDSSKIVRSVLCLGLNYLFEKNTRLYVEHKEEVKYTFEDLLLKIKSIIKSSSNGTGSHTIPLIDLGDFLHVYPLDDKGAVSSEPVDKNNFKNSYFTMSTNYDKRGMVWAKQSMFKSVAYDSEYNVSGLLDNVDYWQSYSQYKISEQDFYPRETVDGCYYSLKTEKLTELKKFTNLDIVVEFNIDNIKDKNVLGLDYYSLYGIKINTLNIKSSKYCSFELLENSLKDTKLKKLNVDTNVALIDRNSGVSL